MPSAPEIRRRVLALALCVLLVPSPALAQTVRPQPPQPDIPTAGARQLARRTWERHPDWSRYVAAVVGDTVVKDELKALIDSGLSVNARDRRGRTALHMAAMFGQVELFRYLARKGSLDLNATDAEGRTPLMIAACLGDFDFKGITSPWERFWTEPLCHPEVAGTPSYTEDLTQWFTLWQAERTLMLFLLGAGADVNAVDKKGRTAWITLLCKV